MLNHGATVPAHHGDGMVAPGAPVQAETNAFDDAWDRVKTLRKEVNALTNSVTLNHRDVSADLQVLREQVASNRQHCVLMPRQIELTGNLESQVQRIWAELVRTRDSVMPSQFALETERLRDQYARLQAKVQHLQRAMDSARGRGTEDPEAASAAAAEKAGVARLREEQVATSARCDCLESEVVALREAKEFTEMGRDTTDGLRDTVSGLAEQVRALHRDTRELGDSCAAASAASADASAAKEQLRRLSASVRALQEQCDQKGEQAKDFQVLREDVAALASAQKRMLRAQQQADASNFGAGGALDAGELESIRSDLRKQAMSQERYAKDVQKLAVQASLSGHLISELDSLREQVSELTKHFQEDVSSQLGTIQDAVACGLRQNEREVLVLRDVVEAQGADQQRRVEKLRQAIHGFPRRADLDLMRSDVTEVESKVLQLMAMTKHRLAASKVPDDGGPEQDVPQAAFGLAPAEPMVGVACAAGTARFGRGDGYPQASAADVAALSDRVCRHSRRLQEYQTAIEEIHSCTTQMHTRVNGVEEGVFRLAAASRGPASEPLRPSNVVASAADPGDGQLRARVERLEKTVVQTEGDHTADVASRSTLALRVEKLEALAGAANRTAEDLERISRQVFLLTGQVQTALGKSRPLDRAATE